MAQLQSRILFGVFKDCREAITVTGVEQIKVRKVDSEVTEMPGSDQSIWPTTRKISNLNLWLGDNRKFCDV